MSSNFPQPFVSVIVPVRNGADSIRKTIEALMTQGYPRDRYEIIVVDNASADNTREIARAYPVILLEEKELGSYAARNAGVAKASGDILAFTDSDCMPKPEWIQNGVAFLEKHSAHVAGGHVEFTFSDKPTPAEYLDSLIGINNQDSIAKHGMAATANLFVRKITFRKVGNFNAKMQSGGDSEWSARAKISGEKMLFIDDAVVLHPARPFGELIKKHVRIGSGSIAVWKARGKGIAWRTLAFFYLLTPFFALRIPAMLKARNAGRMRYPIFRMMLVAYACKLATAWGILKNSF